MSRIRSVHPKLFTDDEFMGLPALARLLLIGLWTEADDQGVFEWKPRTLKARLLPIDECDPESLLANLVTARFIQRFEHSGNSWGAVRNFRKFQRPQKPTAINPLPDELRSYVSLDRPSTVSLPESSLTPTIKSPQMEDGGDKREKKESKKEAPGAIAPPEVVYLPLHMVRAINGDWRAILYQQGLDWLSRHEGKRPNELRSLIGLWLKRSGDDAKGVFDLLAECDLRKVAAPIDWITKALQAKTKPRVEVSPDIVPSSDLAAPASWGDG